MLHPEGGPMGTHKCGTLYDLKLSKLTPNPDQPRKAFSGAELQMLANSIKEKGLLQPILVKELEDGQIIIVSGERRFRAHQLLERETIPAWFTTGDAAELALVENLIREDLTAIEAAEALKKFHDRFDDMTLEDIGTIIGKAKSTVSEMMSLNKLPEDLREIARGDKRFALRELKKIAGKRDENKKRELFEKYQAKLDATSKRTRTTGEDLHQKKISAMQAYFLKMSDEDKIEELIDLQDELTKLKNDIEIILNNLSELNTKFDASNVQEVPAEPKKSKK